MKEQKTIYHLIVDESGSMSDCIDNTITGFNDQIAKIMNIEREFPGQKITVGLTTFNDRIRHHFFEETPGIIQKINEKTYLPNGSTALLDAIGFTVNKIEMDLAISTLHLPTTVIIAIITDGYENASKEYNFSLIRQMIRRLEATGNWTFNFIGATIDTAEVAEQLSISNNSISFSKNEMQGEVWDKLNDGLKKYMLSKDSGKNSLKFFEE